MKRGLAKLIREVEALPGFECWNIGHHADGYRVSGNLPYCACLRLRTHLETFWAYGKSEVEGVQVVLDQARAWIAEQEAG